MKKLFAAALVLLIALPVFGVHAVDNFTTGPQRLAAYVPADTTIFLALRTDEAYVDQLDALGQRLSEQVELDAFEELLDQPMQAFETVTLRDALNMALMQEAGTDLDGVYNWLGDHAAIAAAVDVDEFGPTIANEGTYILVEITDADAAQDFLVEQMDEPQISEEGGYTVIYDEALQGRAFISDDLLILVDEVTTLETLEPETTLVDNPDFRAAFAELPAESYNILSYIDLQPLLARQLMQSGLLFDSLGGLAVGATILDEDTLVIDSVQLADSAAPDVARIDPDFLRFVPTDSSAVVHATNLTALYDSLTATLTDVSIASGSDDPVPQLEMLFAIAGIDLRQDILNWTTGDYALFTRLDPVPAIRALANQELDVASRVDWGLVVEATDAEQAAALAKDLGTLLAVVEDEEAGVTVSDAQINDVAVTVITLSGPVEDLGTLTFELVIGASEEVFFISTRRAAEALLDAGNTYTDNSGYQSASPYLLPDPTSIWVTDGSGALTVTGAPVTIVVLTLLGPQIGTVFENVLRNFDQPGTPPPTATPTPTPTPIPVPDPRIMAVADLIQVLIDSIASTSASSTITEDGATVMRLTLSYSE